MKKIKNILFSVCFLASLFAANFSYGQCTISNIVFQDATCNETTGFVTCRFDLEMSGDISNLVAYKLTTDGQVNYDINVVETATVVTGPVLVLPVETAPVAVDYQSGQVATSDSYTVDVLIPGTGEASNFSFIFAASETCADAGIGSVFGVIPFSFPACGPPPTPPANDDVADAIEVTSFPYTHSLTLAEVLDATLEEGEELCSSSSFALPTASWWYEFSLSSAKTLKITAQLYNDNVVIAIRQGLSGVTCRNEASFGGEEILQDFAAGDYLIQINPYFSNPIGDFTLSIEDVSCEFSSVGIQASDFDCRQGASGEGDAPGLFFTLKFPEPANGSGNYRLYDGETLLGSYSSSVWSEGTATFFTGATAASASTNDDISVETSGPVAEIEPAPSVNFLELTAHYQVAVAAGNKTLTLRDASNNNCSVDFQITIPSACEGAISITDTDSECGEAQTGEGVSTGVSFPVNVETSRPVAVAISSVEVSASASLVPNVSMTIKAGSSTGVGPSQLAVYYRDGESDEYLGAALLSNETASGTQRTYTFTGSLPSGVSGATIFTVVDGAVATATTQGWGGVLIQESYDDYNGDILVSEASALLDRANFFFFEQVTIDVADCGDDDMDEIVNEEDDCDDRIDTDGDNVPDCLDQCPLDRLKTVPGDCGCNISERDSDGDGVKDCVDFCDDTIDTDGDGTSDCKDRCPNDPTKIEPDACGCGTPPQIDSDGDGIVNCMDPCPYDLNQYVDGQLDCGRTLTSDTRLGERIISSYGECSDIEFDGRELFYKFTLYDAGSINIRFKEIGSGTRELQLIVLDTLCFIDRCIGTIAGNPGTEESLVIEDLAAGDYFFAVDSRSFYDRAEFELTVDCGVGSNGSMVSCADDALISEDFEGYEIGTDITSASDVFELYGFSSATAQVAETEGETPNKAIYLDRSEAASDIAFLVGNQYSGIGRIAWNMFVKPNRGATFQLFGHESTVSFGAKYQIDPADEDLQGKWMAIEAFIDLDNDTYTLFIDNRAIVETGTYLPGLVRLNFYAYWNNAFYVDNLCYSVVESVPTSSRVANVENTLLENVVKPTAATTTTYGEVNYETNVTSHMATTFTNDLTVYPNPTKGLLNVNLSLAKEMSMTLELVDPMGRTVRSIQTAKTNAINEQLNVEDLANGLYILRAYNKEVALTKRIIKQ